jgi:uncharacterized protein YihD (DUF1040 family)
MKKKFDNNPMWNKIFSVDCVSFMKSVSREGGTKEDETEDDVTITAFINFVKERMDYKTIVMMAIQWNNYEDLKQASLAIHHVGLAHASRMIMLMDFLSKKFKNGGLV